MASGSMDVLDLVLKADADTGEARTDTAMYESIADMGLVQLPREEHVAHFLADIIENSSLPSPWAIFRDGNGRPFYGNRQTEETSWSHPLVDTLNELAGTWRVVSSLSPMMRERCVANLRDTWLVAMKQEFASWYGVPDKESGKEYYVNSQTGETQWEHPVEVLLPAHYMKLSAADMLQDEQYLGCLLKGIPTRSDWSPSAADSNSEEAKLALTNGEMKEEAEGAGQKKRSSRTEQQNAEAIAAVTLELRRVQQELEDVSARFLEGQKKASKAEEQLKENEDRLARVEKERGELASAAQELEKERSRSAELSEKHEQAEERARNAALQLRNAQLKLEANQTNDSDMQAAFVKLSMELDAENARVAELATKIGQSEADTKSAEERLAEAQDQLKAIEAERLALADAAAKLRKTAELAEERKQDMERLEAAEEEKKKTLSRLEAELEVERKRSEELSKRAAQAEENARDAATLLSKTEARMKEVEEQDAEIIADAALDLERERLLASAAGKNDSHISFLLADHLVDDEDDEELRDISKEMEEEQQRLQDFAQRHEIAVKQAQDVTLLMNQAKIRMLHVEVEQKTLMGIAKRLEEVTARAAQEAQQMAGQVEGQAPAVA